MTPDRFRQCLETIGLSNGTLIRLIDVDPRLFRRWISGQRDVPQAVAIWLENLARHWASNPPPVMRGQVREDFLLTGDE